MSKAFQMLLRLTSADNPEGESTPRPRLVSSRVDEMSGSRRRIVFLNSTFEPEVGGTVRQTATQGRALAARGYRVTVLTQRSPGGCQTSEERDGLDVRRYGLGSGRGRQLAAMFGWTAWLWRHRREILAVQAVMHSEYVWCAAVAGLLSRASMLWVGRGDVHTALVDGRGCFAAIVQRLRRVVVQRARNIVLTPVMAEEVDALVGARSIVIPVPVDSGRFHPPTRYERDAARRRLGLADDEVLLLYVGHLIRGKGVHHLVAALDRLDRPRVRLCVVGEPLEPDDDYGVQVASEVNRLGLDESVSFVGAVEDVRDPFLWAADIFALPSDREGMPNAVLEAMASGVPCILPAPAAGHELLEPAFGVVPDDNSAVQLAWALDDLLRRRDQWSAMGASAREAAERHSVQRVTDAYETVYRSLGLPEADLPR